MPLPYTQLKHDWASQPWSIRYFSIGRYFMANMTEAGKAVGWVGI